VIQIHLRLVQSGFLLPDLRMGRLQLRVGHSELRGRGPDCGGQSVFLRAIGLELRHRRIMGGLRGIPVALSDEPFVQQFRLPNQIALRVKDGDLSLRGLSLAHGESSARVLHIGARPFHQRLLVQDRSLGRFKIGLGLIDPGLEDLRVDARDQLVFLDLRVEVGEELLDLPGNLGAHLDSDDGIQGTGRRDRGCERPLFHRGEPVLGRGAPPLGLEPGCRRRQNRDHEENKEPASRGCRML